MVMETNKEIFNVEDCIFCLDKLVVEKDIVNQVNIGPDDETISINELYKIISNKLQFNLPAVYKPDRPNEVKSHFVPLIKLENI